MASFTEKETRVELAITSRLPEAKPAVKSGSANPWTRKAVETLLYETLLYQATHGGEGYMSQVAGPRLYLLGLAPGAENTQPMQLRDRFTEPMIEFVM